MENSTKGITLETLPKGFTQLTNEVSEIKRQILAKCKDQPTDLPDQLLPVLEAVQFLRHIVPPIYNMVKTKQMAILFQY